MMTIFQPGQMIGAYQIVEQIGKGGMATVFKGYHPAMDRYVAIKALLYQFATSEEFIGRFRQEVRLIANLEHPNILPVYDYGEFENVPFLVMRYLDSGTLKDRMDGSSLTLPEIDHYIVQLADALQYAHDQGVIHRDIKPSNVMLDQNDRIFLTDFGIAKLVEGSPQFTATGAITGTPDYMSPEQAQGLTIDARSDQYSLGIMLYEMLTGKVPFDAETPMAVILKQIQDPLPPPSLMMPNLHPAIEAVLLKMLSKNPELRFFSLRDFIVAWKDAMRQMDRQVVPETVKSSPPPATESAKLPAESPVETIALKKGKFFHNRWFWIGGVLAILLVAVIWGWQNYSPETSPGLPAGQVSQNQQPTYPAVQHPRWTS